MAQPWFQITVVVLLAGRFSEDKSEQLPVEARGRPSPHERSRPALWPTHSSSKSIPVRFPNEKSGCGRRVKLTSYLQLLLNLEMTGATFSFTVCLHDLVSN
jgi:hypothetical protein